MSRGRKPRPRPVPVMRVLRTERGVRYQFGVHVPPGADPSEPCLLSEEDTRNFLRAARARFDATVRERVAKYRARRQPGESE